MKKFIVTYQAPIDATWKTQESTPEEMEEARGLLKDHPHLDWNAECEIDVLESLAMPGS